MVKSRTATANLSNKRKRRKLKRKVKIYLFYICSFIILLSLLKVMHQDSHKEAEKIYKVASHKEVRNHPLQKKTTQKVLLPNSREVNKAPSIDQYLKTLHFNGTALVVKNNQILINKGYGYADMEKKEPNTEKTVHFIGSITKVFVSTAVMQLQEKGRLNINDKLSKYIPDFPNGNQITIYHLLTHTSGISEHKETSDKISRIDLIKKIEKGKLKFKPGSNWYYSDSNYSILAYIVEQITKEPLPSYIDEHVFKPALMQHTGFGDSFYAEASPSKGYKLKDNQLITPNLPDMTELFGCGDIYTTPYDMYLFDKSLYEGKLISSSSLKQFFTPFKNNYAMGLYRDPGSYSDHGVLPGWACLNSFSKNGKTFVVLFSNIENNIKSLGAVNNQIYLMVSQIH